MLRRLVCFSVALLMLVAVQSVGQEPKPAAKVGDAPNKEDLKAQQLLLAARYKQLEETLLRLAQKLESAGGAENRSRAQLIYKAIAEAKERGIATDLQALSNLLNNPALRNLREYVDKGPGVQTDLRAILDILLAEDSLRQDQEFMKQMLEEIKKAIRIQEVALAKNRSSQVDKADAEKAQEPATEKTSKILKKIDERQEQDKKAADEQKAKDQEKGKAKPSGDQKDKSDSKGKDKQKSKDQQKSNGKQQKQGDQKQNPQENQRQQDQQREQQQQEQQQGRKKIQDANEDQKRAEEKLQENQRDEAAEEQEKALQKLQEAKKELEEKLRQLREEEMERLLAALRQRCEKMLQMQEIVYEGTKGIDEQIQASPEQRAEREQELEARALADSEDEIVNEADTALALLEHEGTSVAFTEVLHQVRNDMMQVTRRLARADVAVETQAIEEDIIATLKEMVDALKRAQQKLKDRQNQQQDQQQEQQQDGDQSLIDMIAELKMIKAMQVRVNNRTVLWGKRYQGEQAQVLEIVTELRDLAQRQARIYEITHNIAKGRNR